MRTLLVALSLLTLACAIARPSAEVGKPSSRWEAEIRAFEAADATHLPPPGGVLFIGSSGIRRWTSLQTDFPNHHVINRGFGGSQILDATYFADRIVIPYRPRLIVLKAGGNDISRGRTPEQVAGDFRAFVAKVRSPLPETRIAFFSIQPSPSRWRQRELQQRANRLIEAQIAAGQNMVYIDGWSAFLGPDGTPREELFGADRLHHSADGSKLQVEIVRPYLD